LLGQPELLALLSKPELAQIAQRVSVEYHLEPLGLEDTHHYVRHRLEVAGGDPEIFSAKAIDVVFYLSGGVPRLINTLCDYALLHGFATGISKISFKSLLESAQGRRIGGINHHGRNHPARREVEKMLEEEEGVNLDALFPAPLAQR
jgi:hypothetical protein